ncbi:MAG: thioredoxin domain-containing protein [Verrucomicrobia bacterium]|nr:thioredoxin domain-containing protein [Verrucomicrobiota bacterium]MDA1086893.1 thioredoxin domain-containing protein [Verrucomicrobiota bacterium]
MPDHKPNRLHKEKSPYLLQHAFNPVDWHAWNDEAFETARREDKPIFLSIGYSTCHWCHVMEHESFEDDEVAEVLNENFVSIKVDREERPDIDNIYMTVCQMMTGRGGWPLTIMMSPDRKPFFSATYIPKHPRFNQAGMMGLIPQVGQLWRDERSRILDSADNITRVLHENTADSSGEDLGPRHLEDAVQMYSRNFDDAQGGFGGAPKFPVPHNLLFLLRYHHAHKDARSLAMVEQTLQAMRRGGIYDHVGYGLHRYATDADWLVPHFEKMLYDQALLCMAYIETYQVTHDDFYQRTAREILTYVLRDMTAPDGGFFSAEDADSEGVEGKFYVWKEDELRTILEADDADLFIRTFQIRTDGNFSDEASGHMTGDNIPHLTATAEELAAEAGLSPDDFAARSESIRVRLFEIREARVHPYKDDKILVDWNGLMIAAAAKAARVFGDSAVLCAARNAADFVLSRMRLDDGSLLHRYRDGDAAIRGHLDDYAMMIWGLIELYQATFDPAYLRAAVELQEYQDAHFADGDGGGYFFSADNAEALILRKKEYHDGAIPSGNSVSALNLMRLARMTGEARYEEQAGALIRSNGGGVRNLPISHAVSLMAVGFSCWPAHEVVLVGDLAGGALDPFLAELNRTYRPNTVLLVKPADDGSRDIVALAPFIASHDMLDAQPTAYVCRDNACNAPTTDAEEMGRQLG